MAKMIQCKTCGERIAKSAKVCPYCGARSYRSLRKTLLILLVIIICAMAWVSSQDDDFSIPLKSSSRTDVSSLVTLENFNKIDTSMSYEDVCKLFGIEGTLDSEITLGNVVTQVYHWYNKTGIFNCNVTFQNGMMIGKAQIGLK
ncbi:MAG: hypothetical protein IJV40_02870 [Oscillospiraceae bacterium]|nr:hypothetical protein [Oscillospiraceae bacterium]